jgi:hypothetical protein
MNPRDLKGQGAGKGCRPRNNYSKMFRDNYDAIFSKKPLKSSKKALPLKSSKEAK